MKLITVGEEIINDNIRIDKYLIDELGYSRSKIQKLIANGNILVNDKVVKKSYLIKVDDEIKIKEDIEEPLKIKPEKIDLDICYEDDYLLVVNKPSGMVVHPAAGHHSATLVNALLYHCNKLSKVNDEIRPGIVHRIDKDTSGLLLVAKNDDIHLKLAEQLKERKIKRHYLALVHGIITHDKGTIDAPIGRKPLNRKKMTITDINARDAITHFKVIERLKDATLIECQLETGRTHQIRIHMEYIRHPIVNDPVYGKGKEDSTFGQMLHAKTIGFYHPITNEYLEFEAPVPKKFEEILERYRKK